MLRDLSVNAAKPRYPWVFEQLCMVSMRPRPLIGLAVRPWYPAPIRTGSPMNAAASTTTVATTSRNGDGVHMISAMTRSEHDRMANAIRALAMDAVEQAKSGHPGLPMGAADIATVLFTQAMKFDP